jgi:molecular chaperone IbpA
MVIYTDPFATLSQEFDKLFATPGINKVATYPPYNVIHSKDKNEWYLEFALAGFEKDDITITTDKNVLTVSGETKEDKDLPEDIRYVYKGIAGRKFTRSFTLPEYAEVAKAELKNGILTIDLVINIPEEKKPKTITIK